MGQNVDLLQYVLNDKQAGDVSWCAAPRKAVSLTARGQSPFLFSQVDAENGRFNLRRSCGDCYCLLRRIRAIFSA